MQTPTMACGSDGARGSRYRLCVINLHGNT